MDRVSALREKGLDEPEWLKGTSIDWSQQKMISLTLTLFLPTVQEL